jgi:hypothetical protein
MRRVDNALSLPTRFLAFTRDPHLRTFRARSKVAGVLLLVLGIRTIEMFRVSVGGRVQRI